MSYKFAVLLKPGEEQPALDRAAQYVKVSPEQIDIVAVRVINKFKSGQEDNIQSAERAAFDNLVRRYGSIENMELKIVFSEDIADGFFSACDDTVDMAIISASHRHTIRDLFVSSVDSTIMRKTTIPLLVVKDASETAALGQNVVLAIDFGDTKNNEKLNDSLFRAAKGFASTFDGVVHVANCITPKSSSYMGGEVATSKLLLGSKSVDETDIHYQLAKDFAQKHEIAVENIHILQGRPDDLIPKLSAAIDARMVCMGCAPHSTLMGAVNSSASELVLEQIKGDIFIVNEETV